MPDNSHPPIRVVMFGSGPQLNPDAMQFLCALQDHPEIELLGAFCQAKSTSMMAVFKDLWKRRRLLAFPLFFIRIASSAQRFLRHPVSEMRTRQQMSKISGKIHFIPKIHAPEVLEQVRALQPDLGLVYGSPILKPALFEIPRLGSLGIHHGILPEYRGNKTTFWAMYNGEPAAGVTIQKINEGLDTGSIVLEGRVPTARKSYAAVVRELETLGIDLYIQAILEVRSGTANYQPQAKSKGRLYRNPKAADFARFWIRQTRKRLRA